MDFPFFHLDLLGNRMLVAMIATVHVWVNHAMAVGFIPVVVMMEYVAFRRRPSDPGGAAALDALARRLMRTAFILTTSVGALTGVGIWFSTSLVNPAAIGSLIRVFYGAWFTEWLVFVLEVVFIMLYYLSWKSEDSPAGKQRHLLLGAGLAGFSWLTMAIITAILGFQMDPGSWLERKSFLNGFFNPLYGPQLYFRTGLALCAGGAFALLLAACFVKRGDPLRERVTRYLSFWTLIWAPVCAVGAFLYRAVIPEAMLKSVPVAVSTLPYLEWYGSLKIVILGAAAVAVLVAAWGAAFPRRVPRVALALPLVALFLFLGYFERVREFIRKPYVIAGYLYANGLRVEDYPLYQRDGVLPYAAYARVREVTPENRLRAGEEVFMVACSRCHTVTGMNSVVRNFRRLSPPGAPLDPAMMRDYIPGMHRGRYFMPPFPGSAAEADALAAWIAQMDRRPVAPAGAQSAGAVNPFADTLETRAGKEGPTP